MRCEFRGGVSVFSPGPTPSRSLSFKYDTQRNLSSNQIKKKKNFQPKFSNYNLWRVPFILFPSTSFPSPRCGSEMHSESSSDYGKVEVVTVDCVTWLTGVTLRCWVLQRTDTSSCLGRRQTDCQTDRQRLAAIRVKAGARFPVCRRKWKQMTLRSENAIPVSLSLKCKLSSPLVEAHF